MYQIQVFLVHCSYADCAIRQGEHQGQGPGLREPVAGTSRVRRAQGQRRLGPRTRICGPLLWSLDRFSREGVLETLQHLQRLSSHGVEWFSYREEYLRSIGVFKEAVLAILACIAKQERIRLSERVMAGLSRARAQGKVLGRPRAAVRSERVLQLRKGGLSIRQIADETAVSHMTVQRILAADA